MNKVVQGWLARSPDLNPIENQWVVLKTSPKQEKASTSAEFLT
jgi:transposase